MATAKRTEAGLLNRTKRPFLNVGKFLREVWNELQRVVWPDHEETKGYTLVVMIAVVIVALWVGIWDLVFGNLLDLLIR
jgi:preprotein translocase subunit SecE